MTETTEGLYDKTEENEDILDQRKRLVKSFLQAYETFDEYAISDATQKIVEDIREKINAELIDMSTARRLEDWSTLSHQVVGYESA